MLRHSQIRFRMTITLSLLLAGTVEIGFAQPRFSSNSWNNSYYGVVGGDVSNDFCAPLHQGKGAPGGPAPTVKEAVASAVCSEAYTMLSMGWLVIVDNLKVKIGAKTAEKGAVVFPLSGSFTLFECEYLPDYKDTHRGGPQNNCNSVDYPAATGKCRKNASGAWECQMDLKAERPTGYGFDPDGPWAKQFVNQGVPPPEPEPSELRAVYLADVSDGRPFTASLQPLEKQAGVENATATRLNVEYPGEHAAMQLDANSSTDFRIKHVPGETAEGMLVRLVVENGHRTLSFDIRDGKVDVESLPLVKSKSDLIGSTIKMHPLEKLAPGEYVLIYQKIENAYPIGVK